MQVFFWYLQTALLRVSRISIQKDISLKGIPFDLDFFL